MKELSISRIWLTDDESPTNVGNLELLKWNISEKISNKMENVESS